MRAARPPVAHPEGSRDFESPLVSSPSPSVPNPKNGWLSGKKALIAHYFIDGHSRCHLWAATTLDSPAPTNLPRCPSCMELLRYDR